MVYCAVYTLTTTLLHATCVVLDLLDKYQKLLCKARKHEVDTADIIEKLSTENGGIVVVVVVCFGC